jgi:hypothetical protein
VAVRGYGRFVANTSDLVAVMAELHAALAPGDLAQTLRRVTDAAVELLPDVDGATITIEHEVDGFETAAATGSVETDAAQPGEALAADTAARLDHLQQVLTEGPAVDVAEASEPTDVLPGAPEPGQAPSITTTDLARDDRYPAYGIVAVSSGVRAQVAVVLFETTRSRGVLNLYSQRTGAFDDTAVLTDLFAHHSATALAYAAEYHDRETTDAERRAVGQALGIVMERYKLSEAKAYALMQQTAAHRAVSVRLVAQELVAGAESDGSSP